MKLYCNYNSTVTSFRYYLGTNLHIWFPMQEAIFCQDHNWITSTQTMRICTISTNVWQPPVTVKTYCCFSRSRDTWKNVLRFRLQLYQQTKRQNPSTILQMHQLCCYKTLKSFPRHLQWWQTLSNAPSASLSSPASSQIILSDLLLEQSHFYGFSVSEVAVCIIKASPPWCWRRTEFTLLHFSDTNYLHSNQQGKPA